MQPLRALEHSDLDDTALLFMDHGALGSCRTAVTLTDKRACRRSATRQLAVHNSTGRPVEGLRLKSRLRPCNGAKSSSMSFAGGASGWGVVDGFGGEAWSACRMTSSASLNQPL